LADLLITDADRDALVGAGLLLGTIEGPVTFRVVSTLAEASRLLHDIRRIYTRVLICGVPAADTGSLRSALTVLQVRGTGVWWFDTHDLLWTTEVRAQLDQLGVHVLLPDPNRPETERVSGLVLTHLLDQGNPKARGQWRELRSLVAQVRSVEMGGPDWLALVDAVGYDHRLVTNRALRGAVTRVWEPDRPMEEAERKLVALQRSRETKVQGFLDIFSHGAEPGQELLRFDAEAHPGLRYVRPRMYTEAARRAMGADYAVARVGRGWVFACRDPYRVGLDLPVAFMERLYDLDVSVHGYPYRASVRMEGGLDVDARLMKVLETALEEERTGRKQLPFFPMPDEDIDW